MMEKSEIFITSDWTWRDYLSLLWFPAKLVAALVGSVVLGLFDDDKENDQWTHGC